MKKATLLFALAAAVSNSHAQSITDTVSLATQYASQVWYSLEHDEAGNQPKDNWDLAFQAYNGMTASVLVNNFTGTSNPQTAVWKHPDVSISAFGTAIDTTGLSTWPRLYNATTSWSEGAFGTISGFDIGWGMYDMGTHHIVGDSLYIVQTISGAYKQFAIEQLAGGIYTFKYADLDGANPQTHTITKGSYAAKNFAYFSIDNNAALNREPDTASWDLLFCQYQTSDYAPGSMQGVAGVLHNRGVKVAEALIDPATAAGYNNYGLHTFESDISAIGWDWKRLSPSFQWEVRDSMIYFVQARNGDFWKVAFKGFGGTSNGNYIFSKEKLPTTSVHHMAASSATLALYPNPAVSANVTMLYTFNEAVQQAQLRITDMQGRVLRSEPLSTSPVLHQYQIPAGALPSGMYLVHVITNNDRITQKLVIQ